MSTDILALEPEALADAEAVIAAVLRGEEPDPAIVRRVHERAEMVRQSAFQRYGLLDIGVAAIRELRDA